MAQRWQTLNDVALTRHEPEEIITRSQLAGLDEGSCHCSWGTRIGARWRAVRYLDVDEIGWYVVTAVGYPSRSDDCRPYLAIAVEAAGVPHMGELHEMG